MEWYEGLGIVAVGLAAGFINTVAAGGSLLTLPILMMIGLPPTVANATNRIAILFQNIFAVRGFKKQGVSAYPYSLWLGISALCGAGIGTALALIIDGESFKLIFAGIMILVVLYLIFTPGKKKEAKPERTDKKATLTGIITFFFIGIYGGFIQAGVGILIMISLSWINRFTLVKANGAKVFVVLVYTTLSIAIFAWQGLIDWKVGLILAAGNSTGGWLASQWSVNKGDGVIRVIMLVVVTAMALKMFGVFDYIYELFAGA